MNNIKIFDTFILYQEQKSFKYYLIACVKLIIEVNFIQLTIINGKFTRICARIVVDKLIKPIENLRFGQNDLVCIWSLMSYLVLETIVLI